MLEGSDYLPDIAVGRFSATNPTQLHNIIAKTLSFERVEWTGNDDWEKHATFMASNDNYTVSEGTHNYVITTYLDPLGYISDRLYCHTYNATTQQVRDAFNAGRSQGTYSGHGSETSWADGPPFNQTDVNNLTNTVYPFVQSYACLTGAFTVAECFGETWTRTAHGAVAFWGSSVTSYWTEDDILEKRLYEGFYADVYPEHPVNQTWVGGMTNYAKLRYYEYFGNSGTTRRYLEMYNILGDPSVDVWTDIPAVADVDAPQTLIAGESGFEMTVVGTPYAMASIRKSDGGNDIFLTAWADPSGHVVVNLPEPLTPGLLSIAVTAHDLEPYFFAIQVIQPEGPYLIFDTCVVDDGSGDGNGIAGAGETIGLDAILENVGIDPATGVTASISAVDPYVEILDADAEYGDIPAGGTAGCIEPFVVAVAGDVPDQHTVTFALHVLANEGEWNAEFGIPVQAPILRVGASLIDDSAPGGNGDGGADPGETFYLQLWLGNVGHRAAGQLEGSLSCENLDVVILDGDGGCLGVPVGGEALLSAFRVEVLPTCPDPATLTLQIALAGADGFAADLECEISVGAFFDDVETDRGWTLSAADDNATSGRWVRGDPVGTTYNDQPCQPEDDHSPGTGIQCFVTANGTPGGAAGDADVDGGKTTLLSPVFALGDALSATVEYWRWYTNDLGNNPGQDYWDVDATADGENWVSLEHTTQSANAWNHYSFNLGDTIPLTDQVRLRFVASDESPGSLVEAAVDDFTLTAVRTPATGVTDAEVTTSLGLVSCHPNPFNPRTSILYSVGAAMRVKVGVYDVAGRIVRTLVDGKVDAGQHTILFDGTDEEGHTVSSGVYFLRMETPEILSIRQVTLLK